MSSPVTMIMSRSEVAVWAPRATLPNNTAAKQSGKCVATNARAASGPSIFISIKASSECLNLFDLILAQPEIHRADDARDLFRASHSDDCARYHAVPQSPRDRCLACVAV